MTSSKTRAIFPAAMAVGFAMVSAAQAQSLDSFAILGGSTLTNTGVSTIDGNIGLSPGSAATGFGDAGANRVVLTGGALHINNGTAVQAKSDLTTAYNMLSGRPMTSNMTGQTLGTLGTVGALNAGVYKFDTSAQLNGQLTLNGDADDVFIFQIGSTLTTAPGASIILGGTVKASNVFFVVGSSAVLDTTTAFKGQILALTSITMNNSASIDCGAAWARNGAVTLDTNTIGICVYEIPPGVIDEPPDEPDVDEPDVDEPGVDEPDVDEPDVVTDNRTAAREALRAFIASGGRLPLSYALLGLLTPEELAAVFRELSGEIGTTSSPAAFQAMNGYIDVIAGRLNGKSGTVIVAREGIPAGLTPEDNTLSVMGYGPAPAAHLEQFAGIDSGPMPNISEWTIWTGPYGSISAMDGEEALGTHTASISDYGVAFGADRHLAADTLFGLSLAAGGTNFGLGDSLGSGRSTVVEAALYGRHDIDDAYLTGVVSYARHQTSTDRVVNLGGANQYRGDFASDGVAGAFEAGYEFDWFKPYAGVRGQIVSTSGYSETTEAGSEMYALTYDPRVALNARTEIGARFDWSSQFEGGSVMLTSSVAWAHTFAGANTATASYSALGAGSEFTVSGATPSRDAVLLAAGIGVELDSGFDIGSELNASIASNARTYGASVRLGYSW